MSFDTPARHMQNRFVTPARHNSDLKVNAATSQKMFSYAQMTPSFHKESGNEDVQDFSFTHFQRINSVITKNENLRKSNDISRDAEHFLSVEG